MNDEPHIQHISLASSPLPTHKIQNPIIHSSKTQIITIMNLSTAAFLLFSSATAQTTRLRTTTTYRSDTREMQGTMNMFDSVPAVPEPVGVDMMAGPEETMIAVDVIEVSLSLPAMTPGVILVDGPGMMEAGPSDMNMAPDLPEMTAPTKPMGPEMNVDLAMSMPEDVVLPETVLPSVAAMATTVPPPMTLPAVLDMMSMPESVLPTATAAASEFGTVLPADINDMMSMSTFSTPPMVTGVVGSTGATGTAFGTTGTDSTASVAVTTTDLPEEIVEDNIMSMYYVDDQPLSFEWDGEVESSMSLPAVLLEDR